MAKSKELIMTQSVKSILEKNVDNDNKVDNTSTTVDVIQSSADDIAKQLQKAQTFDAQIFAYTPVQIDKKSFDIYKISIDPNTDKCIAEKMGCNWDSYARAFGEVQKLYNLELLNKIRQQNRRK